MLKTPTGALVASYDLDITTNSSNTPRNERMKSCVVENYFSSALGFSGNSHDSLGKQINWHCQLEGLTLSIACSKILLQQCEQIPMLHLLIAFTSGTSAKKVWFSLSTCWRSFTLPMSGWLLNIKNYFISFRCPEILSFRHVGPFAPCWSSRCHAKTALRVLMCPGEFGNGTRFANECPRKTSPKRDWCMPSFAHRNDFSSLSTGT